MGFAEAVDCPVLLVGDIDKGGVFAQLMGTLMLISDSERERIAGLIINKFRGDLSLLQSGLDWLGQQSGKPILGVVPWLHGLDIESEDAVAEQQISEDAAFQVVVPGLPHISNHTDFDPLRQHPSLTFRYVRGGEPIPPADLIILPGTKNVRSDLQWLLENGWQHAIHRHLRYGGKVLGICGGYQMLGMRIHDPDGLEHGAGSHEGLGLLPIETTLLPQKTLKRVLGHLCLDGVAVEGYEIHHGKTTIHGGGLDFISTEHGSDGLLSEDGQIAGCYLHGLFDHPQALVALMRWAGLDVGEGVDIDAHRQQNFDRLADTLEQSLDMEQILKIIHNQGAK
jgi:adenosylcobyric acid synthase